MGTKVENMTLTAGNVKEGALRGGNPQIARAGVKDYLKFLCRSSNVNFSVVLSLKE